MIMFRLKEFQWFKFFKTQEYSTCNVVLNFAMLYHTRQVADKLKSRSVKSWTGQLTNESTGQQKTFMWNITLHLYTKPDYNNNPIE